MGPPGSCGDGVVWGQGCVGTGLCGDGHSCPSGRAQLDPLLPPRHPRIVVSSHRMLGNRTSEQWVAQYATSHQHPVNRACHTLGIPLILLSVGIFIASIFVHRLWPYALALFVLGWIFQFVGHAFEGKEPEFFHDWRFLFVGVRWWWAKIRGRA